MAAAPLAFAQRLGADYIVDLSAGEQGLKDLTAERPFDVAFEVSGTAAGLSSAILNASRGYGRPDRQLAGRVDPGTGQRGHGQGRSQGLRSGSARNLSKLFASLTRERLMFYPSSHRGARSRRPRRVFVALDRSQSVKVVLTAP